MKIWIGSEVKTNFADCLIGTSFLGCFWIWF